MDNKNVMNKRIAMLCQRHKRRLLIYSNFEHTSRTTNSQQQTTNYHPIEAFRNVGSRPNSTCPIYLRNVLHWRENNNSHKMRNESENNENGMKNCTRFAAWLMWKKNVIVIAIAIVIVWYMVCVCLIFLLLFFNRQCNVQCAMWMLKLCRKREIWSEKRKSLSVDVIIDCWSSTFDILVRVCGIWYLVHQHQHKRTVYCI